MSNHVIIVHAFISDELGEHYLDDRVPPGTEVNWTAYERIIHDADPRDVVHEVPWEVDSGDYDTVVRLARERAKVVGLDMDNLFIEHDPSDVYL